MEKEHWAILIAFFAGCMLANFLEKDMLASYGILNDYFLRQYSYHAVDGNRLFCLVLLKRGRAAVIIFLLGRVMPGAWFSLLGKSIAMAILGFLLTVSIIILGIKGIPICAAALFPQWIFYYALLFFYANCKKEDMYGRGIGRYAADGQNVFFRGAVLFSGMILGMVLECYVNPILLTYVQKFF